MASINLTTGTPSGDFEVDVPFDFTISSSQTAEVTITGKDQEGANDSWFSPDPAKIPGGSTRVQVTPVQVTPVGEYVTYLVSGMNTGAAAHVVVGDSMPAREHEKKAS